MSSANWGELTGSLLTTEVKRGVTNGIARPNTTGSNNFVYGFNSQVGTPEGVAGSLVNLASYSPTSAGKGGSIRGCIQRGVSASPTGFAPFFFIGLQNVDLANVACKGYVLGLSDADPPHLVLRKGLLKQGGLATIPDSAPPANGVLRRSTGTYTLGAWIHIRLDMVVNSNGDVVLEVFQNDLTANPLGTPENWQPVPGMASFVDDTLMVNTGTAPFTTGYMGFGFWVASTAASRRGFFDAIQALRQL